MSKPAPAGSVNTEDVLLSPDGGMFGWVDNGQVTALILTWGKEVPAGFSVMPLAGSAEAGWPPFREAPVFGAWFWGHCNAGRIVDLAPFVGSTQGLVFWAGASGIPGAGAGLIAVEIPLSPDPGRWLLPRGVYAYHAALRNGERIPSLPEVLADPGKLDLGPRF